MRSSAELDFDYSKCIFECAIFKRNFIGNQKRYFYLFEKEIIIDKVNNLYFKKKKIDIKKEPLSKRPDRVLYIELTKRVVWKYSDDKQSVIYI